MGDSEKVVYAYEVLEKELEVLSIWEAERMVNAVKRPAAKKIKREKETGGSEKSEGTMPCSKRLDHLPCQIDRTRSKKKLYYHGVEVEFPFAEPLAPQRQVMEGVVRAILKRECALLESPTGTGKTQALLSASLAAQRYLQEKGEPVGKIIFATRTIGQVRQLPAELRKNPYMALSAPLASRSHYCTNEAINSLPNNKLSNECRKMGRLVERLRKPAREVEEGGQGMLGGSTTQDACGCSLYAALTNRKHAANVHSAARFGAQRAVRSFKNNFGKLVDIEDLRGTPNISDLCALSGRHRTLESDMQKDDEQADKHPMGCAYYTARALAKQSHITFCTYNYLMSPGIRDAVGISSILSDSIVIIDEAHNVESVARDGGSVDISLFEIYLLQQFVECRTGKLRDQILRRGDKEEETIIEGGTLRELLDTIRLKMEEAEDAFVGTGETASPFFSGMPPKITQAERSLKSRAQYNRPPTDRDVVAGFDWGAAGRRPPTSHFFDQFELKGRLVHNAHAEAEVISKAAREADDDSFVLADQCLAFTTAMVLLSAHRAHYAVCVRAWHNQGADYRQSFQPPKQLDGDPSGGDDQRQREIVFNASGQVAISNRLEADAQTPPQLHQVGHNWWSATRKRRPISPVWGFELSVMLLHPGIMIDGLSTKVRALVLASGTLSPVEKTERELGEQFAKRMKKKALEAKHVVCTKNQLAIRAVTSASVPRRGHVELECTANSLNSYNYESQNLCFGIGETIATLSEIAPGGVLVFLPSHKALGRLVQFWQRRSNEYGEPESSRNIWQRILRAKRTVLIEVTDAVENDKIIAKYRAAIASPQKSALLLCAFRGKCSEGISFNDDACRLVICVGIPNLPCFDHIVVRKQDYNNAKIAGGKDLGCGNAADVKCMSGRMWYTTQAFRALNQALGRCIRHLNDYGSIVLCDSRFQSLEHRRHVAAWIRDAIECGDLKQVARHMRQHFALAPEFVRREYRERMGLPAVKAKPAISLHCVQKGTKPDMAARRRPFSSSSEMGTKVSTRSTDKDCSDMLLAAENLVAISGDDTGPAAEMYHAKTARKENLESQDTRMASLRQRATEKKMGRAEQRHVEILFDYDLNETQPVPKAKPEIGEMPSPRHPSDFIVIDDPEDDLPMRVA